MYGVFITMENIDLSDEEVAISFNEAKERIIHVAKKHEAIMFENFYILKYSENKLVYLLKFLRDLKSIENFNQYVELLHIMRISEVESIPAKQLEKM